MNTDKPEKTGRVSHIRRGFTAVLVLVIAATVIFIWSNSFRNGAESNSQSSAVAGFLKSILDPDGSIPDETFSFFIRKSAHFAEFMLLGTELALLSAVTGKPQISAALFVMLSVAVGDESIQILSDRTDSVADILLDFTGAVTGFIGMRLACHILSEIKKRKTNGK